MELAREVLRIAQHAGAKTFVPSSQGSISCQIVASNGRKVYPLPLNRGGRVQIVFDYLKSASAFESEESRRVLYEAFSNAVGPLSTENYVNGAPSFPLERLADPERMAAFRVVVAAMFRACTEGHLDL